MAVNTNHTPGPWRIDKRTSSIKILSPASAVVASLYNDKSEVEATARLIAAAPDMIKALLLAEKELTEGGTLNEVQAAIKKAVG